MKHFENLSLQLYFPTKYLFCGQICFICKFNYTSKNTLCLIAELSAVLCQRAGELVGSHSLKNRGWTQQENMT